MTKTVEERITELEEENALLKRTLFQKSIPNGNDDRWSQNILDSLPNPLFVKNDKHEYVMVNQAFLRLLNHTREEMIGKSDYDFIPPEQSEVFWQMDDEVLESGTTNWNEEDLTIEGIKHKLLTSKTRIADGSSNKYILGLITDITANENQQALLLKNNIEIEAQRKHVQTLLKEVHHRVKNNMQIISSLLNMQMHQFEDEKVKSAFDNCKNRIRAMANVHEILYQTNNFADINFGAYLDSLIGNIRKSYNIGDQIEFETKVESSHFVNLERAIPLGLIVNEIFTNAIKYGAPDKQKLKIFISVNIIDECFILEIGDNGVGMNSSCEENKKGLGLELIDLLSEQLEAECKLIERDKGVNYRLSCRSV